MANENKSVSKIKRRIRCGTVTLDPFEATLFVPFSLDKYIVGNDGETVKASRTEDVKKIKVIRSTSSHSLYGFVGKKRTYIYMLSRVAFSTKGERY